jgi:hypothetical protein
MLGGALKGAWVFDVEVRCRVSICFAALRLHARICCPTWTLIWASLNTVTVASTQEPLLDGIGSE